MDRRADDRGLVASAEPVRAAGGVLWRDVGGRIEVAVVHRPHRADWSLPKGKLDPGESSPEAALREVFEETGIRGRLGRGVGEVTYTDQRSDPARAKVVRYWAVEALEGRFEPGVEVDELRWLAPDEAVELLTYDRDRDVVSRFSAAPSRVAVLLLVRHADAVAAHGWSGDPRFRPVSRHGAMRAAALARMLVGFDVSMIVSSTAVRCVATVAPLAEAAGLRVIAEEELSEEGHAAGPDAVAARLSRLTVAGSAVVACTHAPVISDLLARLGAPAQPSRSAAPGASWSLSLNGGALVAAEYLPPPEV